MSALSTAAALLLDALFVIVMMSALTWREARWSQRTAASRQGRAAAAAKAGAI